MLAEALLIASLSLSAPVPTDFTNTSSLSQYNFRPPIRIISNDKKAFSQLSSTVGFELGIDLSMTPFADILTEADDWDFTLPRQVKAKFAAEFNINKVVRKKAHFVFD